MTDEQINLAIHKAVGFEWNDERRLWERYANKARVVSHNPFYYSSDLNLMHEAEKVLTKAQWEDFVEHLSNGFFSVSDAWKDVCHATARQRAEAFLRTLGKWDQSGDATEMEVQK
jgi:hypothetical protein